MTSKKSKASVFMAPTYFLEDGLLIANNSYNLLRASMGQTLIFFYKYS